MSTHEEDLAFLKKTGQIASAPKPTAQTKKEVIATKEDEIDFFEDPKRAVNQAVENHPAVREAKEQTAEI